MYVYLINIVCFPVSSENAHYSLVALPRHTLQTRSPGILMVHRPADARVLFSRLQEEKEYPKQLPVPQILECLPGLVRRVSPAPGCHFIMSVQARWRGSIMLRNGVDDGGGLGPPRAGIGSGRESDGMMMRMCLRQALTGYATMIGIGPAQPQRVEADDGVVEGCKRRKWGISCEIRKTLVCSQLFVLHFFRVLYSPFFSECPG